MLVCVPAGAQPVVSGTTGTWTHKGTVTVTGSSFGSKPAAAPIVWDDAQPRGWGTSSPGKFVLTEVGTRSLLTKLEDTDEASANIWQNLPGFQWYAPVLRAKAGTEILATHRTETNGFGRVPLIVTKTYGAGKILFMGTDGAWRTYGVFDVHAYFIRSFTVNISHGDVFTRNVG